MVNSFCWEVNASFVGKLTLCKSNAYPTNIQDRPEIMPSQSPYGHRVLGGNYPMGASGKDASYFRHVIR